MNQRELNTVLAALRLYQAARFDETELVTVNPDLADSIAEIADDEPCVGGPLTTMEIDDLCERLNCGPTDAGLRAALQDIADHWPADASAPEMEDYDDTESAYNNGQDVATYGAAMIARAALAESQPPRVLVFVRGGVAEVAAQSGDIEVVVLDADNAEAGEEPTVLDSSWKPMIEGTSLEQYVEFTEAV